MSVIKIRCKCEYDGVEYDGVVVSGGVNIDIGDGCNTDLGKVVTFSKTLEDGSKESIPSPVLFAANITSASTGDLFPLSWLFLSAE